MDVFNVHIKREGQVKFFAFRTDNLKDITVWIQHNINRMKSTPGVRDVACDKDLNWVFENMDGDSPELEINIVVYMECAVAQMVQVFIEPLYIHSSCPRTVKL